MVVEANAREVIQLLLPSIRARRAEQSNSSNHKSPLILGLTGLQGSGKSTWASALVKLLNYEFGFNAIQISIDDLYLTHEGLVNVRESNPTNKLLRTRGQPGTHDEELAQNFFQLLHQRNGEDKIRIPAFDKSRYNGEGDRLPIEDWPTIKGPIDIVVFEGWCVGFQPLRDEEVQNRWEIATKCPADTNRLATHGTLANHALPHLLQVNNNLKGYCSKFMGPDHFDFLVHLDSDSLQNVFEWRLEQEDHLIKLKGSGMSREEVIAFVQGYMPAYELYLDGLRRGFFAGRPSEGVVKRQVTIMLDRQRRVVNIRLL